MNPQTIKTPQAIQACHELILWVIPQLDKFPRARRFTLGSQIETGLLKVLEPAHFYEDYKIPVPDLKIQQTLVAEIETLENKIAEAQKIINEAAAKKQAVLKNYL